MLNDTHIGNCQRLVKNILDHYIQCVIMPIIAREGGRMKDRFYTVGPIIAIVVAFLFIRSKVAKLSSGWSNH